MLYVGESKAYNDLVMEVAISGSPFDHIRKKNVTKKIIFKYFIQAVNSIYFLQQNDVIYREIKTENILLYENEMRNYAISTVGMNDGAQMGTFCRMMNI